MSRRQRDYRAEMGVLLLFQQLYSVGFNAIPPVTLTTIIGQTALYMNLINVPWDKWDVCISGKKVWKHKDYKTLLLSSIEHADDMHLYYNMISFLIKGRTLEYMYGSANFALLLSLLTLMTSGIYVGLSILGANVLGDPSVMNSCAIGFSGVIFALKFITTTENPEGFSFIQGFRVPMKYTSWAELIAIHVLVPNASFLGHLSGIIAGLLYMKTPLQRIIDFLLTSITGFPMIHTDEEYRPRESRSYEWDSSSYSYRQMPNSYGWRL